MKHLEINQELCNGGPASLPPPNPPANLEGDEATSNSPPCPPPPLDLCDGCGAYLLRKSRFEK